MIRTSEQVNEIAKALNKFQSGLAGVKKGAKNPFFKSTYARLEDIQRAIQEPLEDTGLCYIQSKHTLETGEKVLTTRILHVSGQWIESDFEYVKEKDTSQGAGSAASYAKRYGLNQAFGIPNADDDDGNKASFTKNEYDNRMQQAQNEGQPQNLTKHAWGLVTDKQIKYLHVIIDKRKDAGWTLPKAKTLMKRDWKHDSLKSLTKSQFDTLLNIIQTKDWKDDESKG